MKLFGWGKSKDPQPQTVLQQVNNPEARNGSHGPLDRCKSLSGMGSTMPGKGNSTGMHRKKQGLFGVDGYLHSTTSIPKANTEARSDDGDSDEKLQDTIRFVFSHEREGLLAIGTFALEQLQSIRNIIDDHHKVTPDDGYNSSTPTFDDVMQSSDDEDQLQRSWLAARKTCSLPVFGDSVDTSRVEAEAEQPPHSNDSKALTLFKPNKTLSAPSPKPIVLLTALPPEMRRALDPATALLYGKSFLPHWSDAVPPSILAKPPTPFPDDDYYASRLCGLFSKRSSKALKSKRHSNQEVVPVEGEEKKRMIPIELAAQEKKKSLMKFATPGVPSLGKLAKLWRATCKQSTARIAPERKPNRSPAKSPHCVAKEAASEEVFTAPVPHVIRPYGWLPTGACTPKVAEFRKRVQMHERMANASGKLRDGIGSPGHWIKDDEDFVVLEM